MCVLSKGGMFRQGCTYFFPIEALDPQTDPREKKWKYNPTDNPIHGVGIMKKMGNTPAILRCKAQFGCSSSQVLSIRVRIELCQTGKSNNKAEGGGG